MTTGYKKPKNPAVRFELAPREEGEPIEDWIKRETERLVARDGKCKDMRERIKAMAEDKREKGVASSQAYAEHEKLKAANRKRIKKLNDEIKAEEERHRKTVLLPARKAMREASKEHKSALAKYNTMHKRFFNAVKVKVFQNMRSICNIQHTWADRQTKRNLQNSDERLKKRKSHAVAPLEKIEKEVEDAEG